MSLRRKNTSTVTTDTPTKKPGLRRKQTMTRKSQQATRSATYDGEVDGHEYRDGLILIPIEDAPKDEHFVPVRTSCVPPETYYVFDPDQKRIVHMVSVDADGVYLAWDTDRDGRHFTRVGRALMCPRSIEYCYDSSVAFSKGQDWGVLHPDYRGTLSGRTDYRGTYIDHDTPHKRDKARTGQSAAITAGLKSAPSAPRRLPTKDGAKRPLKPKVNAAKVQDGGILSDRGLDQKRLNSEADKMADKYTKAFASGSARKPLRRKK